MIERMTKHDRRRSILQAAAVLATAVGYMAISRNAVARAAGVSAGLVQHHFGSTAGLRTAVMMYAVASGNVAIVAQGLAVKDAAAVAAPHGLKLKATAFLAAL